MENPSSGSSQSSLSSKPRSVNGFPDEQTQMGIKHISRRVNHGFNLIPSHRLDEPQTENCIGSRDARVCYTLPVHRAPQLFLRLKKVIELGAGHGLAEFVIAAVTEASEVVISDGNPQVVNYIQNNIEINSGALGDTMVKSMMLHWNEEIFNFENTCDFIVASVCTFFKDLHKNFTHIVKLLLSNAGSAEAILLSPKRGNSLDMVLEVVKENDLHFSVTEKYDRNLEASLEIGEW